jgi:hypothetical protein
LTDAREWKLAPHVCRYCMGRLVCSGDTFKCSSCGVEAVGVKDGKPVAICGCGMRPSAKSKDGLKSFACGPNPQRSPANPAEIVILFAGGAAKPIGDSP